jgi:phosphatidylserine/phosphatidylglycerophosphate/cardiolipin synthase-like enzyme
VTVPRIIAAALLAALVAPAWADTTIVPEIYYAPETRLDRIDVSLIENAETSIDMAAYILSDWDLIDALNDAAAGGVKVRVILDPREHTNLSRLAGLDIRQKRPGPIQHLKAFAVDGAVLRTGSENFSHAAPTQDNDLIIIRDPAAAAKFKAHFERMWTAAIEETQ